MEYLVTLRVSYEVYCTVDADNKKEAIELAIEEVHDPELISNHSYSVMSEPTILEVEGEE
tara:strand:+ start:7148 stop:7327 length:180 start_codon:yes stop_codon:yes gene_type:complete